MLSRLVRDSGFKVVMTGEGADEVFAGYDIFKEAKVRRFCAAQPNSKRRPLLLKKLYPYMPRLQAQSQRYLEAFFGPELARRRPAVLAPAALPLDARAPRHSSRRPARGARRLRRARRSARPPAGGFNRWHPLSQSQYLETAHLLPGYILSSQGDRVGMAHAVEGRFPFLDHRLVELAARIPPRLKLKGLAEKYILRQSMRRPAARRIATRPKQPYRAPESQRSSFGTAAGRVEHCRRADVDAAGYFDAEFVDRLVQKCARPASTGFRDNLAFVGILSTQVWHETFIRGRR